MPISFVVEKKDEFLRDIFSPHLKFKPALFLNLFQWTRYSYREIKKGPDLGTLNDRAGVIFLRSPRFYRSNAPHMFTAHRYCVSTFLDYL